MSRSSARVPRRLRGGAARRTNASMTRRVTPGASSDSPAATTRIAAASSSAGASLSRKPEAPARSASKTYSSRSKVVSTSTRVGTRASTSCRVAAMPSSTRHPDVHQRHVGPQPGDHLDGLLAVGRLADDLEVGLGGEQRAEPGAHHALVVDDHQPGGHVASRSGRLAASTHPTATVSPRGRRCRRRARPARGCRPVRGPAAPLRAQPAAVVLDLDVEPASGGSADRTSASVAPEWRRALVRPSWAMRYAARSTPGGRSTGLALHARAGPRRSPAPTCSTSRSSSARPGCGASADRLALRAQHAEQPAHLRRAPRRAVASTGGEVGAPRPRARGRAGAVPPGSGWSPR